MDREMWNPLDDPQMFINELIPYFRELEGRSWNDIFVVSKKQNHGISTGHLNKVAIDRMSQRHLDYDMVYSIRVKGRHRLYGLVD
ncbi:MAG: hypothetical protein IJ229_07565 [Clostridia bacterium]|nr:hypothetical protein [Clostridia bacterium]